MAKSKEKNQALKLRQQGKSIKQIAKKIKIAKSTVSLWCRDIELTPRQIKRLHERMVAGSYRGRLKGARTQYKRRLKEIKESEEQGIEKIGKLSERDLLLSGLALYWGEGAKKGRHVRVSNSDPEIIKFIIWWFKKIWKIKPDRFACYVGINKIHKDRVGEVEEYWSKITAIPRKQFRKTILIKAKSKKVYKNFSTHYGTLAVDIRKPAKLHYQIMGLIEGLIYGRYGKKLKNFPMPRSRPASKAVS